MKFQPILNFESITPQTTKGDLIGRTSAGATRVAVGADGTVLTADSSLALGMKWASAGSNFPVNTLTGATTLPAVSQIVLVSGTTFAVTVPTAVGNSGLEYFIKKTDASFTTAMSLLSTSAQTFDGVTSATLSTQNEGFGIVADGGNWQIKNHKTNFGPTSYSPNYGAGFGTVTNSQAWWTRTGSIMRIFGSATSGTVAAAVVTISLPTGATVDTSRVPSTANANSYVGRFIYSSTTGGQTKAGVLVVAGSGTALLLSGDDAGSAQDPFVNQNGSTIFGASNKAFSFWAEFPVTGWSA